MKTVEAVADIVTVQQEPVAPVKEKMTFEEFLAWCDEDTWAEWVDGEVEMVSPASDRHQTIKMFLVQVLSMYVSHRGLGRALDAPFLMRLPRELSRGREPDVLFIAQERLHRLRETYLDGPADVVVEITSPESLARDRGTKFWEYETGGVREYWLIDPQRQQAEFYRRGEDGLFRPVLADSQGVYRSEAVPGFWLRVEWLWQEPLPSPLRALGEIGGVDPALVDAFERALRGE